MNPRNDPATLDDWDDGQDARIAERPPAPVTVLLDPHDDAAVTAALLVAHDPAAGRITVHPTPAVSSPTVLAHELLRALGHPVTRLAEEKISGTIPAWQAVTAWITAENIDQLVVLRAHRLAPAGWQRLLELWRCTGVTRAIWRGASSS